MNCQEARESAAALLAGRQGLTEWGPIEAHAHRCDECRQALDQVFRAMPAEAPARRSFRTRKSRSAYPITAGVVMVALLAGLGGYAYRVTRHGENAVAHYEPPGPQAPAAPAPAPVPESEPSVPPPAPAPLVPSGRAAGSAGAGQASAPVSDRRAPAAPKPIPPTGTDVVVQLSTQGRKEAARDLSSLVVRVGGANVAGGRDSMLKATVPRSRYPEFTRGLGRIGSWEVQRRSATLPDPVRVTVRLAAR